MKDIVFYSFEWSQSCVHISLSPLFLLFIMKKFLRFVITHVEWLFKVTDCNFEWVLTFSSAWSSVNNLPSCSLFLCCDWLWLAAGSESGRSSPYYGQEGRSSTPTTNQPPKHFHVPGRTPHLLAALSHNLINELASLMHIILRGHFTFTGNKSLSKCVILLCYIVRLLLAYFSLHIQYHFLFYSFPSYPLVCHLLLLHVHFSIFLCLSSATGDPNIYRKPPIYKRTGTVQLAPP